MKGEISCLLQGTVCNDLILFLKVGQLCCHLMPTTGLMDGFPLTPSWMASPHPLIDGFPPPLRDGFPCPLIDGFPPPPHGWLSPPLHGWLPPTPHASVQISMIPRHPSQPDLKLKNTITIQISRVFDLPLSLKRISTSHLSKNCMYVFFCHQMTQCTNY